MADKSINELVAAEQIKAADLFVLEQDGSAKKLTGQTLLSWLTKAADGHGGVSSIEKLSTSGLNDTYRITLADATTFDFVVSNGRGIQSVSETIDKSKTPSVHNWTFAYNDGTSDIFSVSDGQSVYLSLTVTEYILSNNGRYPPANDAGWSEDIPVIPSDSYLWTRTTLVFSNDDNTSKKTAQIYTVTYCATKPKAPVPYNYLKNSCGFDMVNQRGISENTTSDPLYCFDRWQICNGGTSTDVDTGLILSNNGSGAMRFFQRGTENLTVAPGHTNRICTLAMRARIVKAPGELTFGAIFFDSDGATSDIERQEISPANANDYEIFLMQFKGHGIDGGDWGVEIRCIGECRIYVDWIALYPGEYSLDDLPEYQRKGYAATKAECLQYYYSTGVDSIWCSGHVSENGALLLSVPVPSSFRNAENMHDWWLHLEKMPRLFEVYSCTGNNGDFGGESVESADIIYGFDCSAMTIEIGPPGGVILTDIFDVGTLVRVRISDLAISAEPY